MPTSTATKFITSSLEISNIQKNQEIKFENPQSVIYKEHVPLTDSEVIFIAKIFWKRNIIKLFCKKVKEES